MELLSGAAAKQLFRGCTDIVPEHGSDLAHLEARILTACDGLPLALEIIGGQLWHQTDLAIWQVGAPAASCQRLWTDTRARPAGSLRRHATRGLATAEWQRGEA